MSLINLETSKCTTRIKLKTFENVLIVRINKLNNVDKKHFLPGIYRDKTMANKLMWISNDDTQKYPFCRLQFVVETFGHSTLWTNQSKFTEVPKVIKPTIKKTCHKTLGTIVRNSQLSLPSWYFAVMNN